MRNFVKLILMMLLIVGIVLMVVACKPTYEQEKKEFDVNINTVELAIPLDLEDYSLKIEWFDKTGQVAEFNKNKPTVVIFNGFSEYNRRETLTLSSEVYNKTSGVISSSIADKLNLNMPYYWNKLVDGYNVGVFHYENFADEEELSSVNSKIYDSGLNTYKNKDGNVKSGKFNLTEAFYSIWKKSVVDKNMLSNATYNHLQEVRFIGNSIGANLAISCADYLYAAYEQNLISATYVPNRVTLTSPWFSNTVDEETKVTFRKNIALGSALAYNENRIKELAQKGVVFELIENDSEYFNSYDNIYDGYLTIEHEGKFIYSPGNGRDVNLYKEIKSQVAYLTLKETFSTKYADTYKKYDRAALDWYLYTAGGSDITGISDRGEGLVPVYDSRGHASVSITGNFSLKYGISAWTSTVYTRAMRGVEYNMQTINSNTYTDYTMTSFQSEANQVSNLDMTNGYFICGYIYHSKDESEFVNLRPDAHIAGYNFTIVAIPENGSDSQVFNVTTYSDGFYKCMLNESLYGCKININLVVPSENYRFLPKEEVATGNQWQVCDKNSIGRDGVSRSMSADENSNFYIEIRNAGFVKEG